MSASIARSFAVSFCSIFWSGTPVTFEMMCIMSSAVTSTSFSSRCSRHSVENALQLFLGLLFLVAQRGGFFEILRLDRGFLVDADLFDLLFDFLDVGRPRHGVDARARTGFIHHVDRLVRQKTGR